MAGYSPVIGNRMRLDLYANVRPVKLYPGVHHRIHGKSQHVWEPAQVDMVFVRENTEGLYSPTGGMLAPGNVAQVGIDTRVITRRGSRAGHPPRVRDLPPQEARRARRRQEARHLHRQGQRAARLPLFRDIFFEIGEEYPEIEKDTAIVDAFTQWLIDQARVLRRLRHDQHVRRHRHRPRVACSRAAWAWRSAPTSATSTACSSRSTAPRPSTPARTR